MVESDSGNVWGQIGQWAWDNKEWVAARIAELRRWLLCPNEGQPTSSILIIGPGGVGKTTFARMLSGQYEFPLEIPGAYEESLGLERFTLDDDPNVELVVPPGQRHRRDATWTELERTITAGGYHGVILTSSYGYHSLGQISYKQHRLYHDDDAAFLADFLRESRVDEINVLRRLLPHLRANARKSWMLTLVTKQDLWWNQHALAESDYRTGEYGQLLDQLIQNVGSNNLRHEFVFSSLIISNFTTGVGELLANTVSGYDQNLQANSLRRLWETVDALKKWEEQT